jgi:hypothetical protein
MVLVCLTRILFQSPDRKFPFLLTEPGCCTREIGKNKVGADSDENSQGTFDNLKSEEFMEGHTKSHLQARSPRAPSRPPTIPAAINPEKAPEIKLPEYRIAVRKASSFRVYQLLRKKRHPGKYAASMKPRKNRQTTRPV